MNRTPLIRDGKMTGNPLEGGDVKRLDYDTAARLNEVYKKAKAGKRLSQTDTDAILKARAAMGLKSSGGDSMDEAAASLGRMLSIVREMKGRS